MENGITKATDVRTICPLWDIPLAEAIPFGGSYNDIEILETVEYGFLMGNAPEELKQRIQEHSNA